jgi:hypothetical protein
VQTLLSQIRRPDGRGYWDRAIDGRGGPVLERAIAAFQGADPRAQDIARLGETGAVRAASLTLRRLLERAPDVARHATVLTDGGRPVVFSTGHGLSTVSAAAARRAFALRTPQGAVEALLGAASGSSLAGVFEHVSKAWGLEVALADATISSDRVAVRLEIEDLKVLGRNGLFEAAGHGAAAIPPVVWRVVDDALRPQGWKPERVSGLGRRAVYSHSQPISVLARAPVVGDRLFTRFGIPLSGWGVERKVIAVALSLIARADRLSSDDARDLDRLVAAIALKNMSLARELEDLRHLMARGLTKHSLKYRTPEEIMRYLGERGELDRYLELVGHALTLVSIGVGLVALTSASPLIAAGGGASAVIGVFSILGQGPDAVAREVEKEREAIRRDSARRIAGIPAGATESRREFLLRTFRLSDARFRVSAAEAEILLDLMEDVLTRRRVSAKDAVLLSRSARIRQLKATMQGPAAMVVSRISRVNDLILAGDTHLSAPWMSDDALKAYRLRLASWDRALTVFGAGKNLVELHDGPLPLFELVNAILRTERARAQELARRGLARSAGAGL